MPRRPRTPCATLKSTDGKSESTTPSQRGHTLPRQASTWESQPIAMRAGAAGIAMTAVTEGGTAVDTTPEGPPLLTTEVGAAVDAIEVATGRDRGPTLHVVIELKVQSP